MPPSPFRPNLNVMGVGRQPIKRANATGRLDRAAANLRHRRLVHYSPLPGILPSVLRWLATKRLVVEENISGWTHICTVARVACGCYKVVFDGQGSLLVCYSYRVTFDAPTPSLLNQKS